MVKTVELTGGQTIARTLQECGVEYWFHVIGGIAKSMPLVEEAGVKLVLCRNEKGAAGMADGYSRITGRPSICWAQHGAAAAILASVLYEPMFCHSPVVALTGATPTKSKDRFNYQECHEMPYFQSTCKFSADVTDMSRLADYIRTAVQIAVSGCPGPTHVSIHHDMQNAVGKMPEIYGDKTFFKVPPFRPRAEPERVTEAANLLANAERPVMICGTGIHLSRAYDEVKELAELLMIPVATNYRGKGCFSEEHPLSVGVTGAYGRHVTNNIVRDSDVVFFVGMRADPATTDEMTAPEPGKSKIIHLDIDPIAIGRNYKADVPLVGDARLTLKDLLSTLRTMVKKPTPKGERLQEIAKAIKEYERVIDPMMSSDSVPIRPQRMMREIQRVLGPRDIVVSDTGNMIAWSTRLLRMKNPGMPYITCGGTLGSSFAMAMGVSFGAERDQRVINVIGDGGMGYNIHELETARRYNDLHAPFVTVINDNHSYGQVRYWFEDWTERTRSIRWVDFGESEYAKIAEAFGGYGVRVERPNEIAEAVQNAFKSGKPAIVDVITDPREYLPFGPRRHITQEPYSRFPVF